MTQITWKTTVRIKSLAKDTICIGVANSDVIAKDLVENVASNQQPENYFEELKRQLWDVGFLDYNPSNRTGKCIFRSCRVYSDRVLYLSAPKSEKPLKVVVLSDINNYPFEEDKSDIVWHYEMLPNWIYDSVGAPRSFWFHRHFDNHKYVMALQNKKTIPDTSIITAHLLGEYHEKSKVKTQTWYLEVVRVKVKVKKGKSAKMTYTLNPDKPELTEKMELWDAAIGGNVLATLDRNNPTGTIEENQMKPEGNYNVFYMSCKQVVGGKNINESTNGIIELDLTTGKKVPFFYDDPKDGGSGEAEAD